MPTPAPEEVTTWMIWTQAVIPVLGVLASTAVAIVALILATQQRRADKAEAKRERRAEFASNLRQWIVAFQRDWTSKPDVDAALRTSAARLEPEGVKVLAWLDHAVNADDEEAGSAWVSSGPEGARIRLTGVAPDFAASVLDRLDRWERGARFDRSPFTSVPPSHTSAGSTSKSSVPPTAGSPTPSSDAPHDETPPQPSPPPSAATE